MRTNTSHIEHLPTDKLPTAIHVDGVDGGGVYLVDEFFDDCERPNLPASEVGITLKRTSNLERSYELPDSHLNEVLAKYPMLQNVPWLGSITGVKLDKELIRTDMENYQKRLRLQK